MEESLQRVKNWDNSLSCQNKGMKRPSTWEDTSNSLIHSDGLHGSFIPPDGYTVCRKVTSLYPHCDNNLMTWRWGGGGEGSRLAACIVCRFYETEGWKFWNILTHMCDLLRGVIKTPIEKRLNCLAWGYVRNHMEAFRISSFHTCFFWHQ